MAQIDYGPQVDLDEFQNGIDKLIEQGNAYIVMVHTVSASDELIQQGR